MFHSSGIHLYDVKIDGKHTDGNNSGIFGFKLRRNDDNKDFESRRNQIFKKMNEMGLKMTQTQNNTKRPM